VTDDPYVDVDAGGSTLKLAVDTAHFGRVFQDRTHVFILRPRPPSVGEKARLVARSWLVVVNCICLTTFLHDV